MGPLRMPQCGEQRKSVPCFGVSGPPLQQPPCADCAPDRQCKPRGGICSPLHCDPAESMATGPYGSFTNSNLQHKHKQLQHSEGQAPGHLDSDPVSCLHALVVLGVVPWIGSWRVLGPCGRQEEGLSLDQMPKVRNSFWASSGLTSPCSHTPDVLLLLSGVGSGHRGCWHSAGAVCQSYCHGVRPASPSALLSAAWLA